MKSALDDETTFTNVELPRTSPASVRPAIRPPARGDEDEATLVYSSTARAALRSQPRLENVGIRPRLPSVYPPPPADRPRVFERPATPNGGSARTMLRPARGEDRTALRPATFTPFGHAVRVETPSIGAMTSELGAHPILARLRPEPKDRMALAAVAALFAPIALAFAFLGVGDATASQATLVTPPLLAAAVLTTVSAPPATTTLHQAPAPVDLTPPHIVPPAPPPPVVAPPPHGHAPRVAVAPAPRPAPAKPPAVDQSSLPDAQAASALARAQLDAALR